MKSFIEILKYIGLIFLLIFILSILINSNEENPHEVIIDGKKYIRSKEYVGDGHYQIILLPKDSVK
jgi:hypothetical protein